MDERRWIYAIQRGNKNYLQDIAEKYYDDIYRFCAFQTGNPEDAFDLAQETFLRFIRYVESYRYKNLKGYLLTIAMNLCRNWYREKSRVNSVIDATALRNRDQEDWAEGVSGRGGFTEREPGEGTTIYNTGGRAETPEECLMEKESSRKLREALNSLPVQQREAILLHYFYDMKYREIARITETNTETVKSRVKQGRDKLRSLLEKEEFFDDFS